jgi:hypothetical protein
MGDVLKKIGPALREIGFRGSGRSTTISSSSSTLVLARALVMQSLELEMTEAARDELRRILSSLDG